MADNLIPTGKYPNKKQPAALSPAILGSGLCEKSAHYLSDIQKSMGNNE
jgi:hypothetical protein